MPAGGAHLEQVALRRIELYNLLEVLSVWRGMKRKFFGGAAGLGVRAACLWLAVEKTHASRLLLLLLLLQGAGDAADASGVRIAGWRPTRATGDKRCAARWDLADTKGNSRALADSTKQGGLAPKKCPNARTTLEGVFSFL